MLVSVTSPMLAVSISVSVPPAIPIPFAAFIVSVPSPVSIPSPVTVVVSISVSSRLFLVASFVSFYRSLIPARSAMFVFLAIVPP